MQWLGNAELFVDYIDVYDEDIWQFYFKENYNTLVTDIVNYNQQFSELGTNLKCSGTINEPHTFGFLYRNKKSSAHIKLFEYGKRLAGPLLS